jgi:tetratricopeptide (TPR) repeat protein
MSEANNLIERGIRLINSGQSEIGMEMINKAILLDPDDPEKFHFRGELFLNSGKPRLAIIDFLKAINLNNNVYQYHYNLGCAYIDLKQYENALSSFYNASEINLYDSEIFTNRGICYSHLGYPLMAVLDLNRALEINPNDHIASRLIGMLSNVSQGAKDLLSSQYIIRDELHKELDAVFYSAVEKSVLLDGEVMEFFAFYTVDFINENLKSSKSLNEEDLNAVLNFTFDFMRKSYKEGYLDAEKLRKVKMIFHNLIQRSPEVASTLRINLLKKIFEKN